MKKTCILILMAVALATTVSCGDLLDEAIENQGPLTIGMEYGGGIIAYIYQPGDPGYVEGETHGLIAATEDQDGGSEIVWAVAAYQSAAVGGTGTELGNGPVNTDRIIAQNGAGTTYAAGLARAYNGGGYNDWYLPSLDELNKLYLNREAIGGFANDFYWSSSEYIAFSAWYQNFYNGYHTTSISTSLTGFVLSGLFELFSYSTIFLPAKAGPFFFNPVTFIPFPRQRCAVIITSVAPTREGADNYPRLRVRPSFPDAVNALISPPPFPLSSVSPCLRGQPSSFNHSCLLVLISGFNPDIFLRALRVSA